MMLAFWSTDEETCDSRPLAVCPWSLVAASVSTGEVVATVAIVASSRSAASPEAPAPIPEVLLMTMSAVAS